MSKKRIKEMGKRAREKKAAEALERHRQSIEAPSFRQVVDIETHGSARFFVQHPDGTTHPLRNVPPDLAEREFRRRSSALRDQIEAALWGGMGDVLPPMGQPDNQVATAQVFLRNDDGSVETVAVEQMIHPELVERRIWQGDERTEEYGQSLAEAVLPLAIAEIEAGGVGTAGLSSRSVDGFTDSYEEFTRTFRGIYGPSAVVPSFADVNEASHEDLVRALATGNDSQLSEEFISQRLSEPVPTAKVFPNGITPWKKEEESSEAAGPTAQEQVKALLESPHTPDCVRWRFIAGILEEFLLRDWVELDIEPRSDFLESIQAIKQLADDKITFRELRERRGRLRIVLPYDSPCSARYVSHSYRYKVPYEWQLAHLRDLIAEHNKHRLPLLLCLKERAQRIKQAPRYGQQLEEVLYT